MPSDTPFAVRVTVANPALIIEVDGELDLATAPVVALELERVAAPVASVVVDLSAVTFLDSSGLNVLVRGQGLLAERDIAFAIVSPADPAVRRVFEITELVAPLNVTGSRAEALDRAS